MAKGKDRPDTRARIYDAVRRYPGIHIRGIERETGLSAQLVLYHLKRLTDDAFVELNEQGGYTRYYPTSKGKSAAVTPADMPLIGLMREEVPLHIALLLLDNGAMTHGDLVVATGVAKSTLSYHLAKLAEAGVVEREGGGSTKLRLVDRDRIYRLLLTYRPTEDLLDAFSTLWRDLYR